MWCFLRVAVGDGPDAFPAGTYSTGFASGNAGRPSSRRTVFPGGRIPGTQYLIRRFGESWFSARLLWAEDATDEFLQAFDEPQKSLDITDVRQHVHVVAIDLTPAITGVVLFLVSKFGLGQLRQLVAFAPGARYPAVLVGLGAVGELLGLGVPLQTLAD